MRYAGLGHCVTNMYQGRRDNRFLNCKCTFNPSNLSLPFYYFSRWQVAENRAFDHFKLTTWLQLKDYFVIEI